MQATTVVSPRSPVPASTGRRGLTSGVYQPGVRPAPVVVSCVWCGKPIEPAQKRMAIGFGILHNEPETPCVDEFDALAYGHNVGSR